MNILAIETATGSCSVALALNGSLIERSRAVQREHAELLLPWIQDVLAEAGVQLKDLDALAYSRGPGSFTSLRIGIGVVQGLAWGADLPVIPVSSLQSAAQAAAGQGVSNAVVALDARMGEVYYGRFQLDEQGLMQPAGKEQVCPPGEVRVENPGEWAGVGNGFEVYPELSELGSRMASLHADVWPQAASMVPLAEHWAAGNSLLNAAQAQPVYLRDDVADKPGA